MKRLLRLMAPVALLCSLALPASAEMLSLGQISQYLNGFTTGSAKFSQLNEDGTISTGTLYIKRPGRMRFEYDPPNKALVLASGSAVTIYDPKANGAAETYPLSKTPLGIILQKNVDLSRSNMVTDRHSEGGDTVVRAQDPEHPDYGYIDLVFSSSPVALRQWVLHDASGSVTTVVLNQLKTGMTLNNAMFMGGGGN
ncbi:outer-membrane lipoprotein carrier protein LolA [Pseudooceanicola sp. CBS1P-1]|uniref:Outer membrane lipoprotein carrier protein LolA n=1 Tax=Pseudooceanicola albus TaxID=2692189 RepID=A0A6L7GB51_9RHOB|nr:MULTISPECIES: outer membrane lipoprotein carrier protein LolA [Pseudooceanicola]MBT9386686.1 outer-membrane lipoprotein carrier protein LolA [Pseudooceanicola endophyticus]MXN20902.1 outer membrane lipoprotein carrier protein LolA [Pseudooceanicola albus]